MSDRFSPTLVSPALNSLRENDQNFKSKDIKASGSDVPPYNIISGVDPLDLAYLFIFDSVQTGRDIAQTQAKDLQVNALQQNNMIGMEDLERFQSLSKSQLFNKVIVIPSQGAAYTKYTPKKVAATVLQQFETQNQEISAIRSVMEDQINELRQNAQVNETNINSTSDDCQQSIQQGGSLMQMLQSLTNQVSRI